MDTFLSGMIEIDSAEGWFVTLEDIAFNKIEIQCPNIEHIFLDIFLPKTKPILIGILYRPPKQRGFLNTLSTAYQI